MSLNSEPENMRRLCGSNGYRSAGHRSWWSCGADLMCGDMVW